MGVIELTASRTKIAFRFVGAVVLLAGTIFALLNPEPSGGATWPLWFCIALSLALFAIFGWQLIKPPRLITDSQGFTFTGTFREPRQVAWRDVEEFYVLRSGRGNRFIGYNLKTEARENTLLMKVNHHLGADGLLPSVWPMSAEALVEKLNSVRQDG